MCLKFTETRIVCLILHLANLKSKNFQKTRLHAKKNCIKTNFQTVLLWKTLNSHFPIMVLPTVTLTAAGRRDSASRLLNLTKADFQFIVYAL